MHSARQLLGARPLHGGVPLVGALRPGTDTNTAPKMTKTGGGVRGAGLEYCDRMISPETVVNIARFSLVAFQFYCKEVDIMIGLNVEFV